MKINKDYFSSETLLKDGPADLIIHTLSFLDRGTLAIASSVNKFMQSQVETVCSRLCQEEGISSPLDISSKTLWMSLPQEIIGRKFWEKYYGIVEDIPPIPRNYLREPNLEPHPEDRVLVYIPESIAIKNEDFVLDETVTADGKYRARLIETPFGVWKKESEIYTPMTPHNLLFLTQKKIEKEGEFQPRINPMEILRPIREQIEDTSAPSHWACIQKTALLTGQTLEGHQQIAQQDGLEIVPLMDKIVCDLSSYIRFDDIPDCSAIARTATRALNGEGELRTIGAAWSANGSLTFWLVLSDLTIARAAVGVPAEEP